MTPGDELSWYRTEEHPKRSCGDSINGIPNQFVLCLELEEQCWLFIDSEEVFNEETAFLLFMEAKRNGQIDVMQLMIPRIRKFFLTLVSSQDFLELSAEEVCAFLSSNYIYINW